MIKYTAESANKAMAAYIQSHKQDWIYISTYGLWCGVSEKKQKHNVRSSTYTFADQLNHYAKKYGCNVQILVGIDYGNSPMKHRLYKSQCEFRDIKFYKSMDHHAKYILCSDGMAMIGSANFTDSSWYDVSIINHLDYDDFNNLKNRHEVQKSQSITAWRCKQ